MNFKDSLIWRWWKEYGKHVEAFLIIGLLILVFFTYYNNTQELKDAKKNHPCILYEKTNSNNQQENLFDLNYLKNATLVE